MTTSSSVTTSAVRCELEIVQLPDVDAIVTARCASTGEDTGTLELQRTRINGRTSWRIAFVSVNAHRRRQGIAKQQLGHVAHGALITAAGAAWADAVG